MLQWQEQVTHTKTPIIAHTRGDTFYKAFYHPNREIDLAEYDIACTFNDANGLAHPLQCSFARKTIVTLRADPVDTRTWAVGMGAFDVQFMRKLDGFTLTSNKWLIQVSADETVSAT